MRHGRRVPFESEPDVCFTRESGRTNKGERGERAEDQRIGAAGGTWENSEGVMWLEKKILGSFSGRERQEVSYQKKLEKE